MMQQTEKKPESATIRGKMRLALFAGLNKGDRAVELSDRVRAVLADPAFANLAVEELLRDWPEDDDY